MDILDRFIENAKQSLEEGYYNGSVEEADVERRSLRRKLDENEFALITEIKHASPAGEYEFRNIDVEKTAFQFRECGADAISVVVEPKIFRGNIANIAIAKKAGLPVLFKDFIFSKKQITAAKKAGADCILLVMKVAERLDIDINPLIELAHRQGLEVLLESYDEEEFRRAMRTKADILGINNRELTTLKVDLARTERILEAVGRIDRPLISESGIKTAEDVLRVKKAGAKGALVGTAIWKAEDLRAKIAELKSGGST